MSVTGRVLLVAAMIAVLAPMAHAFRLDVGLNTRIAMAGNTSTSRVVDETSWALNPGGLSFLGTLPRVIDGMIDEDMDDDWCKFCGGALDIDGDLDLSTYNLSARQSDQPYGFGLGYIDVYNTKVYGAGFGRRIGRGDLGWGINYMRFDPDQGQGENTLSAGVYGRWDVAKSPGVGALRGGAVVRDITEDWLPRRVYDVGLAMCFRGVDLAVDVADASDEIDRRLRLGLTYDFSVGSTPGGFTIGAGLDQGDPTAGLEYNWVSDKHSIRAGIAWQENDAPGGSDTVLFGLGYGRNIQF